MRTWTRVPTRRSRFPRVSSATKFGQRTDPFAGGLASPGEAGPPADELSAGDALVVQAHQGDDVANVAVAFDPARRRPDLARKHGMVDDAALVAQLRPHLAGE